MIRNISKFRRNTPLAFVAILLAGCQSAPVHHVDLTPVTYAELPGWEVDPMIETLPALKRSCAVLLKQGKETWGSFCSGLDHVTDTASLRSHVQSHLRPYRVSDNGKSDGLFTGYYEPELKGSRRRSGKYKVPLYKMPSRGVNYKIPRSQIVKGALAGKKLELVWVDDAVDAFFLQIQGSGRVRLEDGGLMRLGYAGQNGKPYVAIGKPLLEQGALERDNVTMQSIKAWLKAHPNQAESIMSLNPSYVFFRINKGDGPIGSQGVALIPQRSLAVDRDTIQMGIPIWLDITHPVSSKGNIRRMVVAQDTGGAIKGGVRGDFFWGHGPDAEQMAGIMKSSGQYYVLLPK